MAGHSQFKNIMHRKGRVDAVRSKLFAKLAREITVSAKLGAPDPAMNPRLRAAILAARAENMPKDNIERAIKKAPGGDARELRGDPLRGLRSRRRALIVEAMTDNRNRTASDVRSYVHQERRQPRRDRRGLLHVRPCRRGRVRRQGGRRRRRCWRPRSRPAPTTWRPPRPATRSTARRARWPRSRRRWRRASASRSKSALVWKPQTTVAVDDEAGEKLLRLLEMLEDHDDVQNVYGNFEISDALMARMGA